MYPNSSKESKEENELKYTDTIDFLLSAGMFSLHAFV